MKRWLLLLVLVVGVQLARADYDTNSPWLDTNAMTVQDPNGVTHSTLTEYGAFWTGFGCMVGMWAVGWCIRLSMRGFMHVATSGD